MTSLEVLHKLIFLPPVLILIILTLIGCTALTTDQYEAAALTRYAWQVKYADDLANEKSPRFETFSTTSILNRNGLKPEGAVVGPDDLGLWWPTLPPRPSVDEVEQRKQLQQQASKPELLKSVEYRLTYTMDNHRRTLPTNYDVYRQVAKVYLSHTPLQLTLGIDDKSVENAEPIGK